MHLLDLSEHVKKGVQSTGLVGFRYAITLRIRSIEYDRFNTVGVSDAISMGTDGMSFSLQSRDLIADSVETVMSAQWYDALITLPGALLSLFCASHFYAFQDVTRTCRGP